MFCDCLEVLVWSKTPSNGERLSLKRSAGIYPDRFAPTPCDPPRPSRTDLPHKLMGSHDPTGAPRADVPRSDVARRALHHDAARRPRTTIRSRVTIWTGRHDPKGGARLDPTRCSGRDPTRTEEHDPMTANRTGEGSAIRTGAPSRPGA